jgi:hypothetical protein
LWLDLSLFHITPVVAAGWVLQAFGVLDDTEIEFKPQSDNAG